MKKSILILVLMGTIFTSCKTAQQKENAAKNNIAEAKQDLADTKANNAAEWKSYKASAQIKIADNKKQIGVLKDKMNQPGNTFDGMYRNRIEKLEAKNMDLEKKLIGYDGNATQWETFKGNFNRDMDEIGNNIKDLFN
ncbi:hypothetical protein [Flavobacterium sp. TSSA_36]|uniref:hypothetical protein n=1 Tax=Flavobacterium sp. TSSA_36 TaxID=3447669 RepID=UPI003F2C925E